MAARRGAGDFRLPVRQLAALVVCVGPGPGASTVLGRRIQWTCWGITPVRGAERATAKYVVSYGFKGEMAVVLAYSTRRGR